VTERQTENITAAGLSVVVCVCIVLKFYTMSSRARPGSRGKVQSSVSPSRAALDAISHKQETNFRTEH